MAGTCSSMALSFAPTLLVHSVGRCHFWVSSTEANCSMPSRSAQEVCRQWRYLAGLVIALTYALLTRLLLHRGVDPLLACLTVAIAVAARHRALDGPTAPLFIPRGRPPAGAARATPTTARPLLCGSLRVWANLHGGFVYGWILITLYLIGSMAERVWNGDEAIWRPRVRHYSYCSPWQWWSHC